MDGALIDIAETVSRLEVILASEQLAQRDLARCQNLAAALRRPARICFVGAPGTDLISVIETSLDLDTGTLRDMPDAFEILGGPSCSFEATLADGTTCTGNDWPGETGYTEPPVFLRLQRPLPVLDRISILALKLDRNPTQHRPALAWAAGRSDIGVFCVESYGMNEARLWNALGESLRDHAYLMECHGSAEQPQRPRPSEFIESYRADPSGRDSKTTDLLARVLQDVDDARQADLDATKLFLHQRGIEAAHVPAPVPVTIDANILDRRRQDLSEPLLYLIGRARALSQDLAWMSDDEDWAEHVLAECCETAEELCDRSMPWTEGDQVMRALQQRLEAMRDTLILLQVEANRRAARKAAALMEQIRSEFEHALDPSGFGSTNPT